VALAVARAFISHRLGQATVYVEGERARVLLGYRDPTEIRFSLAPETAAIITHYDRGHAISLFRALLFYAGPGDGETPSRPCPRPPEDLPDLADL
jgi:hypothetical protein